MLLIAACGKQDRVCAVESVTLKEVLRAWNHHRKELRSFLRNRSQAASTAHSHCGLLPAPYPAQLQGLVNR